MIALSLRDPREEELPAVGLVELRDAETGERALVDTFDPRSRAGFANDWPPGERAFRRCCEQRQLIRLRSAPVRITCCR